MAPEKGNASLFFFFFPFQNHLVTDSYNPQLTERLLLKHTHTHTHTPQSTKNKKKTKNTKKKQLKGKGLECKDRKSTPSSRLCGTLWVQHLVPCGTHNYIWPASWPTPKYNSSWPLVEDFNSLQISAVSQSTYVAIRATSTSCSDKKLGSAQGPSILSFKSSYSIRPAF